MKFSTLCRTQIYWQLDFSFDT